MSPRKRTKDKHLPPRVYYKDGGYYFVDTKYKWHFLGNMLAPAMTEYANTMENTLNNKTMHALFDRYIQEISPQKSPSTHRNDIYYLKGLRAYFGAMIPDTVTAQDVYRYMDMRSKTSIASANKEMGLLSRALQMGIKWGILNNNVCRQVERLPENISRNRYVEDWEFESVYQLALLSSPIIACVMMVGYLTGLRLGDLLNIKIADLNEQGILVTASKTKKTHIIGWSNELRIAITMAKNLRGNIRGFWLFARRDGKPYTASGFKAMWQRLMKLAMNEDKLNKLEKQKKVTLNRLLVHWMFKDIRAKSATDVATQKGLSVASDLLQHSDLKTTRRHYIRREEIKVVEPVR